MRLGLPDPEGEERKEEDAEGDSVTVRLAFALRDALAQLLWVFVHTVLPELDEALDSEGSELADFVAAPTVAVAMEALCKAVVEEETLAQGDTERVTLLLREGEGDPDTSADCVTTREAVKSGVAVLFTIVCEGEALLQLLAVPEARILRVKEALDVPEGEGRAEAEGVAQPEAVRELLPLPEGLPAAAVAEPKDAVLAALRVAEGTVEMLGLLEEDGDARALVDAAPEAVLEREALAQPDTVPKSEALAKEAVTAIERVEEAAEETLGLLDEDGDKRALDEATTDEELDRVALAHPDAVNAAAEAVPKEAVAKKLRVAESAAEMLGLLEVDGVARALVDAAPEAVVEREALAQSDVVRDAELVREELAQPEAVLKSEALAYEGEAATVRVPEKAGEALGLIEVDWDALEQAEAEPVAMLECDVLAQPEAEANKDALAIEAVATAARVNDATDEMLGLLEADSDMRALNEAAPEDDEERDTLAQPDADGAEDALGKEGEAPPVFDAAPLADKL